jgi:ribosomal RNA assembly protein
MMHEDYEEIEEEYIENDAEVDYSDSDPKINGDEDYVYTLKIPKDRIAVLIGSKGAEKRYLEKYASANIDIDSKEGDVTISGKDTLKLFELREVIKAIGRGFNPEYAKLLMKADYLFEIINLKDYGFDTKDKIKRIRSRVIGTGGKARKTIESLTGSFICVYGKTISIIGRCDEIGNAKRAVELLVKGSMHATVYKWLENQRRKLQAQEAGF